MLIMFCAFTIKAQVNLVPNPSFEIATDTTLFYSGYLYRATPWYSVPSTDSITVSTDYWNPTYWSYSFNIPVRTGNGVIREVVRSFVQGETSYREYAQVRLLQPLVAGKTYHVGYYYCINKDVNASKAVMNMGFRFSNDSLLYPTWFSSQPIVYTSYLGNNPPYSYTQDTSLFNLPVDTFSWMKLEHYYIAQGGEEYLTIGNLNNNASTEILTFISNQTPSQYYITYLIDDVYVLDIEQLQDTDLVYIDTFNVGVPITYNCIENSCIDPANATVTYATLAACQASCNATAIEENNTTKQLLKITNVLGRESKPTPNVPLFYRYDDGTVEKKLIIE
jgi:hypothetical protein